MNMLYVMNETESNDKKRKKTMNTFSKPLNKSVETNEKQNKKHSL